MTEPQVLYEEIIEPARAGNPRNSEASAIELQDGRILLAWSDFYGGPTDFSGGRISARVSEDSGRTWGDKVTLEENTSAMNTFSPALLRLQSGAIAHFYIHQDDYDDVKQYMRKSFDEGKTWTEEVCITPERVRQFLTNDRAVQMANGRIVLPISWARFRVDPDWTFRSVCWISDDEGATWTRGSDEISLPGWGAMEPVVVERRDGSLLMVIRTQLADQYRAESYDGGDTWINLRPMGLVSPESPANVKRIPSTGDLLIVWNRVFDPYRWGKGRTPLNSAISRDDGETWENIRDLERDPDLFFAYPSILFHQDEVLLTYYQSRSEVRGAVEDRELKVKIVPVSWFYASAD